MNKNVRTKIANLVPYKVSTTNYRWTLNANESPANLFDVWQEEILAELKKESINLYPSANSDELREMLAKINNCSADNIVCGNGSDEIIKMITEVYVDQGDKVIIPTPTFSEYFTSVTVAGGEIVPIESKADFTFDIDAIIDSANQNQAKLIFLCVPNNPTGCAMSQQDIDRIILGTESIIAIDEAYFEFYGKTSAPIALKNQRIIVMRTLSKAFGVAGIRLGYAIAQPETIDLIQRVRMPYNISALTQAVARVAVKNSEQIQQLTQWMIEERNRMIDELSTLNLEIIESHTNFILYRSEKFEKLVNAFESERIGVRIYPLNPMLKNCIRISLGTKEANDAVIAVFKEVVNNV
ncbi:MAG: histidinol-phosphate transaminase [Erysipelotrichaceae bacterium]|nr:histidinol-phosphate transaminase [Erysipelotrichaceae bacterium]MDP3306513.1 histidinol-phosphate transaminase [Erysipelotrichaceae bacterium]